MCYVQKITNKKANRKTKCFLTGTLVYLCTDTTLTAFDRITRDRNAENLVIPVSSLITLIDSIPYQFNKFKTYQYVFIGSALSVTTIASIRKYITSHALLTTQCAHAANVCACWRYFCSFL